MQHAHDAPSATAEVGQTVESPVPAAGGLMTADVIWLQRSAGNAAVGRLLRHACRGRAARCGRAASIAG